MPRIVLKTKRETEGKKRGKRSHKVRCFNVRKQAANYYCMGIVKLNQLSFYCKFLCCL